MMHLDKAEAVLRSVRRGDPSVVLICSISIDVLSGCSRDFVRTLRSEGARVEFYSPGITDSLLQATNKLLESMPVDAIRTSAESFPPHLLIIDDAERLSVGETAALRRLVQGLRGSAFRVLLLACRSRSEVERLPFADLNDLMVIWNADSVESESPVVAPLKIEQPSTTSTPETQSPVVVEEAAPIPDVLADLARERAETRGFDTSFSYRWMAAPLKVTVLAIVVLLLGYGITTGLQGSKDTEAVVYDCGSHPDRASIDVLLARIGRSTPTRVTTESGRFRLQIGPFSGRAAAEVVREQVWVLGACRINPVAVRAVDSLAQKTGG